MWRRIYEGGTRFPTKRMLPVANIRKAPCRLSRDVRFRAAAGLRGVVRATYRKCPSESLCA